jgi:hypothetical protein
VHAAAAARRATSFFAKAILSPRGAEL